MYEWKPKQKVIGYRVTTDVTLKLKDFSKIGPITQQLADANVSERQTLNYTLENIDEAKNKAVEDAYRRARNSADDCRPRQRSSCGGTFLRLGRHFRKPTHRRASYGTRYVRDAERRPRSHGRIHTAKRYGHRARECAFQFEVK